MSKAKKKAWAPPSTASSFIAYPWGDNHEYVSIKTSKVHYCQPARDAFVEQPTGCGDAGAAAVAVYGGRELALSAHHLLGRVDRAPPRHLSVAERRGAAGSAAPHADRRVGRFRET